MAQGPEALPGREAQSREQRQPGFKSWLCRTMDEALTTLSLRRALGMWWGLVQVLHHRTFGHTDVTLSWRPTYCLREGPDRGQGALSWQMLSEGDSVAARTQSVAHPV